MSVPEAYRGMDRFEARAKVVEDLVALGLVEKIEPNTMKVPFGDRSHEVIEPYLTDQWYVDAKTLAQPALEAVREGKTTFIPENWQNVYFQWLENIQPWCISRQLWWGHQIPAWYGRKLELKSRQRSWHDVVLPVEMAAPANGTLRGDGNLCRRLREGAFRLRANITDRNHVAVLEAARKF